MLTEHFEIVARDPCPYSQFAVVDVNQLRELTAQAREEIRDVLVTARFAPSFLANLAEELGWEMVKERIVDEGIVKRGTVSRGDFGEAMFDRFLEEHHGYIIPVKKLRFKVTAGQSLPGTDILAFRLNARSEITEVCYVESKLRTIRDYTVAVKGYEQLREDFESRLPEILTFIAARLDDRSDPLLPAFRDYLRNRLDTTDMDYFRLGLCWDFALWNERALDNLEDNGVELPTLVVHVLRIEALSTLCDEILTDIGSTTIIDDD
jgi:hypothetical protein